MNRPDDLKRVNQKLRDVGNEVGRYGKLAAQGVSQLAFGDEGTIPWWMSFAPGADLTDKVMEGRRPGLLDIPGPGTLGKIAMLPIMKFGSKEILEGGARMGKNARNLAKTNDSKDYVTRFHRTMAGNVDDIEKSGLTLKELNPNYGRNTCDDTPNVVWLGTSPYLIPVLRHPMDVNPSSVAEFKVKMPKDFYNSVPRYRYIGGRGNGKATITPKGASSLTDEGTYKIDMIGASIPPNYLERIPIEDVKRGMDAHDKTDNMISLMLTEMDDDLAGRLMNEHPQLEKRINRVAESEYGDAWLTGSDKSLGEALDRIQLPISERFVSNKQEFEDAMDGLGHAITYYGKSDPRGVEVGRSPYNLLSNYLRNIQNHFGMDAKTGKPILTKYYRPETKLSDIVGLGRKEPDVYTLVPGPGDIAPGAISRGVSKELGPVGVMQTVKKNLGKNPENEARTLGVLKDYIKKSSDPTKYMDVALKPTVIGDRMHGMMVNTNLGSIGRAPDMKRTTLPLSQLYDSYRRAVKTSGVGNNPVYAEDLLRKTMKQRYEAPRTTIPTSLRDLLNME